MSIKDLYNNRFSYSANASILSYLFSAGANEYSNTSNTNYTVLGYFNFPGTTKFGVPTSISAIVSVSAATAVGQFRIYNPATSQVIAELLNINNTTVARISMGALSNLPANPTMFEIHGLRVGTGQVRIHSLEILR